MDYLKKADLDIVDLKLVENNLGESKDPSIYFVRNKFTDGKKIGTSLLYLNWDESEGTKKYFYLLGPIIDALETGSVLVVDELDSKLHPNLVCKLVSLFNSKVTWIASVISKFSLIKKSHSFFPEK